MTTPRPDAPLDPSVQADFPTGGGGLERYGRDPGWHFDTLAVHGGFEPDAETGSVAPPIYQTSTYAQEGVERPRHGWEYARTGNPTRARLEGAVAALEGARHGLAFASGSATTATIAALALSGDEVVVSDDVYGGTYRLFERVLRDMGVSARYVDLSDDPGARAGQGGHAADAARLGGDPVQPAAQADRPDRAWPRRSNGARAPGGERPILVVDNTFASPAGQQPLELGADIIFHSATKYLAGHSDTVNGVLATSRDDLYERLAFLQNAVGAVPGPFDCFLVLRGLRTLPLRVERHAANATAVAQALAMRPDVARLRYPGLARGSARPPAGGAGEAADALPGRHGRASCRRPATAGHRTNGPAGSWRRRASSPWPSRSAGSSRCASCRRS